jgi:YidC/Oxa1 family membrane protein insertase
MEENKIDINSLIGFFLIGLIFIGWLWLNPPPPVEENTNIENSTNEASVNESSKEELADVLTQTIAENNNEEELNLSTLTSLSDDKKIKLETEKFSIEFSSIGGQISSLRLKEHLNYLGKPVNLIGSNNSTFDIDFVTKTGRSFNTKNQFFVPSFSDRGSEKIIQMRLDVSEDVFLEYTYTINDNDYIINLDINSSGFKKILDANQDYNIVWELDAIRNSKSIDYENRYSYLTYYHDDDKIDYLSISGEDEDDEEDINWISYKQHFFSSVIIPESSKFKTASFESKSLVEDNSVDTLNLKKFSSKIPFEYVNNEFDNSLKFYFGPNQFSRLKSYEIGLEESVDFGWGIFGFINKNIFVPLYKYLSGVFPYGIAIIFMTFIVRICLAPLLYKSYLSQAKMKILRPELDEINKKFKDNAMKKQQETMAFYRKAGANPMSGCLPGLLQIPVFYALFMFFPSAFDLRQKSFLWAEDLSAYDSILDFGFYIPFYGDHVSLFPILAAISIFFYMKMTTGQQMASQPPPQEGMPDMTKMMKYMIYFAPLMLMVFFNNYSSGLSLYYFISNLLSIAVMYTIKNYILDEQKIRQQIQFNKSQPVKPPSRFQRRMQAMMEEAERQKKNKN